MESSEPRRKASAKSKAAKKIDGGSEGADRFERIAVAAYYRAEARGFAPGLAMDDWLNAEADVDRAAVG